MKLSELKKWLTSPPALLLIATAALLLAVWFLSFSKNSTPSKSKWLQQAKALRLVGAVLRAYLPSHDDHMPADVRTLKQWADSRADYQALAASGIWSFVSPADGKVQEWRVGDLTKGLYLYAPETYVDKDGVTRRLVLQKHDMLLAYYNFIKESDFKQMEVE